MKKDARYNLAGILYTRKMAEIRHFWAKILPKIGSKLH